MQKTSRSPGLGPGPRWGSLRRSPHLLVGWERENPLPITHPPDASRFSAPRSRPPRFKTVDTPMSVKVRNCIKENFGSSANNKISQMKKSHTVTATELAYSDLHHVSFADTACDSAGGCCQRDLCHMHCVHVLLCSYYQYISDEYDDQDSDLNLGTPPQILLYYIGLVSRSVLVICTRCPGYNSNWKFLAPTLTQGRMAIPY